MCLIHNKNVYLVTCLFSLKDLQTNAYREYTGIFLDLFNQITGRPISIMAKLKVPDSIRNLNHEMTLNLIRRTLIDITHFVPT